MEKDKPIGITYVDLPKCSSETKIARAMQKALGWIPDPVLDSGQAESVEEALEYFFCAALKYKQEHKTVPVLIIDNVNRPTYSQQMILDLFQDYAKLAADQGTATIVFVSSEGRVPRRMMERSSWSRRGKIIEISDVNKEEALLYLKLREINKEQAPQIYELVGGRMIHLKGIADIIKESKGMSHFKLCVK